MVHWFSALTAYSGERTDSRLGTPIVNRTTTTFFVHLHYIRNCEKYNRKILVYIETKNEILMTPEEIDKAASQYAQAHPFKGEAKKIL
jgi:hypothetical protein